MESKLVEFLTSRPRPASGLPVCKVGESLSFKTRDGVPYTVHTTKEGVETEVDSTLADAYYETMQQLVDAEFPGCPFAICLEHEALRQLDEPFTAEATISVLDDRASGAADACGYSLPSQIEVSQVGGRPITLRQILIQMSQTPAYAEMAQRTDHNFFEGFEQSSAAQYTACFGS